MKITLKHFTFLFVLFLTFPGAAQTARLFTSSSGLPSSRINSIMQDREGFIWAATDDGLARYDGSGFLTFHHDPGEPSSLASNLTLKLLQDAQGVIWVGTSTGLQTFDPESNTFSRFNLDDPRAPDSSQYIYGLLEVPTDLQNSEIIVSASQHGLYVIDAKTHQLDGDKRELLARAAGSEFINRMFLDSKGRIWLASEMGGLAVVDKFTLSGIDGIWAPEDAAISHDILVTAVTEDSATGTIIIGSSNYGLLVYSPATGMIHRAASKEARECKARSLLSEGFFRRAGERTVYVGTENDGLFVFDINTEALRREQTPRISQDISTWKIHSLMNDNQGNIWINAFQTGLMVVPNSMFGFLYFDLDGSQTACVTSIIDTDASGDFWAGTDGHGLYHVGGRGQYTNYSMDNSSLPNNSVMSIAFDKRGTLWIATFLDGLVTYTPSTGFRKFENQNGIGSERTFCLAYDETSDLLYVGTHGNGMSIVDASTGQVVRTISEDLNKWISTLFIDSTGTVWVGTFNGPMCYNPDSRRLFSYRLDNEISTSRVYAFAEGSDGNMWIGTGDGLVRFRTSDQSCRIYTVKDGLSSNVIDGIIESEDKLIWISTSSGLTCLNPADGKMSRYYAYDGLQGNEFRYNAAYKGKNGRLYFGGTGGLTAFYPQITRQRVHDVPEIQFTKLTVSNEEVEPGVPAKKPVIDKIITKATRIILPYSSNSFILEYAVPEYTNPQRLRYSYKLANFDKEWKSALHSGRNALTYTNIPRGKHTLTIKAYFDGDEEHCSSKSISIRVLPPAALSWWAHLLYLLFAFSFLGLAIELIRKNRRQEEEEKASKAQEMRLEMFTDISQEIRNPLTLVMSPLRELRESENDVKKKELYNLMYRNSLRILRLVNQVSDIRQADSGQITLHFVETDLVYFIKDVMKSFENIAGSSNIEYTLEADADVADAWIDQASFDKTIFNILSSAFKHTSQGGRIKVTVSAPVSNEGYLAPEIAKYFNIKFFNTGSQLSQKDIDKLFDRFFRSEEADFGAGAGMGLNLAKTLVGLHHGRIKAENEDGGVAIIISLPAGSSHLSERELAPAASTNSPYVNPSELKSIVDVFDDRKEGNVNDKELRSKRSIVIIDANEEMLGYMKMEMKDIFNVKTFTSAKDAWTVISTTIPDAIVTDIMAEGEDLCSKVKHNPGTNHIPVLILTSSDDDDSAQRCIECGADRVFVKPVTLSLLKSSLIQAISTRETIKNKFSSEMEYNYEDVKIASTGNMLLSKIIQTIKDNIANPDFGVEELSREVGISRVHMNRKLKESINISPSNLIKSIRLKQAAYLLINNKVNISEVAYRVGFSTHSYFSSSFHDYFGLTPKEFVAKYANSSDDEELKKLFEI